MTDDTERINWLSQHLVQVRFWGTFGGFQGSPPFDLRAAIDAAMAGVPLKVPVVTPVAIVQESRPVTPPKPVKPKHTLPGTYRGCPPALNWENVFAGTGGK